MRKNIAIILIISMLAGCMAPACVYADDTETAEYESTIDQKPIDVQDEEAEADQTVHLDVDAEAATDEDDGAKSDAVAEEDGGADDIVVQASEGTPAGGEMDTPAVIHHGIMNGIDTKDSDVVQQIIDKMTLRQKIEQMMMVEIRKWKAEGEDSESDFTVMNDEVRDVMLSHDFGAVIYFANNIKKTEDTFKLTEDMQAAATEDGGVPLIIATDQEGGIVYRLGSGTALPGNMAIGATWNSDWARKSGQVIGRELSSVGINTTLAPVVDVNNNPSNPVIGLRSYSDDAKVVGEMAAETIRGMAEYNVIGCAKHFPGHGDTGTDSHYGLPVVDKPLSELKDVELAPYKVAIDEGIEMIMSAHILYPQLEKDKIVSTKTGEAEMLPATMSDDILTGMLKGQYGFKGIICTDAMNMAGIADKWDIKQAVKIAINAGVDMVCMPSKMTSMEDIDNLDAIISAVEDAVEKGEISEDRIDDACTRILTVKLNRGILDYNASDYTLDNALNNVGSKENREIERKMSAAAVTLIKNNNKVLPLSTNKDSKILMAALYDDELGEMVMGWNRAIEAGKVSKDAEVRTVVFDGDKVTDYKAYCDRYKKDLDWADTVIVLSEVSGPARANPEHSRYVVHGAPKNFVKYAKEHGKKSVVMSVSNPYDVQLYPEADAVLAVYGAVGSNLDPTEALIGGITDSVDACGPNITAGIEVACGTFDVKGKLPVNVPAIDYKTYEFTDTVKYERGYGLEYCKPEIKVTSSYMSYNGKRQQPKITVSDNGVKLTEGKDYKVGYTSSSKVGKYTVKVTGIGLHDFSKSVSCKIVPKKTSIKKLVKGRRYIKVTVGKVSKQCSGYTVQVASNSKFTKGVKTVSTKSYKTTVKKISNLKSGKKYYVRVRAYKKVNGTRYSGSWSKVRTVTVK